MISSLPQATQDELEQLARRYGQPLIRTAELRARIPFDPLYKSDRYGEVCMVVRRLNGRLLTMKKHFYPLDAYRLPTGGINHGEQVFDALLRETYEETGLAVNVRRFLAIAAYHLSNPNRDAQFYTFAFLLDEVSGTLGTIDKNERVEAFREIESHELPVMADYLEGLSTTYSEEISGTWGDWGQFRAVIHRLVWEALI